MKILCDQSGWIQYYYGEKLPNLKFRNLHLDEKVFKEKIQLIVDFVEKHPTLLSPINENTAEAPIHVSFNFHLNLLSKAQYLSSPFLRDFRFIEISDDLKGDDLLDAFVFEIGNALNPKMNSNLKMNELSSTPPNKAKTAIEYADDMETREFDTYKSAVQFSQEAQKCGLKGFRTQMPSREQYMTQVKERREEAYHGLTHHEQYQQYWLRYKESCIGGWFGKIQDLQVKKLCLLPLYCLKMAKNYHQSLSQKIETLNSEKAGFEAQRKAIESVATKWMETNSSKKEMTSKKKI